MNGIPNHFNCTKNNLTFVQLIRDLIVILTEFEDKSLNVQSIDIAFVFYSDEFVNYLPNDFINLSAINYKVLFNGKFAPQFTLIYKRLLRIYLEIQDHFLPVELGLITQEKLKQNRTAIPTQLHHLKNALNTMLSKLNHP